jgi:hypothetical protein
MEGKLTIIEMLRTVSTIFQTEEWLIGYFDNP